MYENGDKLNQNYNKDYEFYFKAAELGEARSQYSIARFYANGFGVKANQFEAFKWFKKAANNIDAIPEAMTNLGYCYGNGVGTKIDNKKALKWYLKTP